MGAFCHVAVLIGCVGVAIGRLIARAIEAIDFNAAFLTRELSKTPKFQDFLTLPAYSRVLATEVYTA